MMPFCDCMSGGFQFRAIDSDVVASMVRFTGGMLGAAVLDYKMVSIKLHPKMQLNGPT